MLYQLSYAPTSRTALFIAPWPGAFAAALGPQQTNVPPYGDKL